MNNHLSRVVNGAYLVERAVPIDQNNRLVYQNIIVVIRNQGHNANANPFLVREVALKTRHSWSLTRVDQIDFATRQLFQPTNRGFDVCFIELGRVLMVRGLPQNPDNFSPFFQNNHRLANGCHLFVGFNTRFAEESTMYVAYKSVGNPRYWSVGEVIPTFAIIFGGLIIGRTITKNQFRGRRYNSRFGKWNGFGGTFDINHLSLNYNWPYRGDNFIGIYLNANVRLVMTEECKHMSRTAALNDYSEAYMEQYNALICDDDLATNTYRFHHTRTLYLGGTFIILCSQDQRMSYMFARDGVHPVLALRRFRRFHPHFFATNLDIHTFTDYIIELNTVTPDPYSSLCWGLFEEKPPINFMLSIPDGNIQPIQLYAFDRQGLGRIEQRQRNVLRPGSTSPIDRYCTRQTRVPILIDSTMYVNYGMLTNAQMANFPHHRHLYAFIDHILFEVRGHGGVGNRYPNYHSVMMAWDFVRTFAIPAVFEQYRNQHLLDHIDSPTDGVRYNRYRRHNNQIEYVPVMFTNRDWESIW